MIKDIIDRIDGRPKQSMEHLGEITQKIISIDE